MSRVLVTGATGLLGRHLCERLLARGGEVVILVREARLSQHAERLAALSALAQLSSAKLTIVHGDVTEEWLGLGSGVLEPSTLDHVFHVAGHYDLTADAKTLHSVNVEGTENLLTWLASRGFGGVLHHVSSIAVAGDFSGCFGEAMLEAGQRFPTEYHRSKYESERLVRGQSRVRYRIYRPGAIVGHSRTGEMDRLDGAYYLFRAIHALRDALPRWVTLPGIDGAPLAIVPVDFVADAIDAIALRPDLDGKTFHLVDSAKTNFRETFNLIADAAGAPRMGKFRLSKVTKWIPGAGSVLGQLGAIAFLHGEQLEGLGIPKVVIAAQNREVSFDTAMLDEALARTNVRCPPFSSYVEPLWDYYVRHLDPTRDPVARDRKALAGKVMLVTGASSGIGEALAHYGASIGMKVLLVARRDDELARVEASIVDRGGVASHFVADLTDHAACDAAVKAAVDRYGRIDVLVNNAGRSIRRPLAESLERFHDLERVMQINYFGPARLIRAALPTMVAQKYGVILNVLSAGARSPSPRFGAYTASKAALGQLGDTLAAEHLHDGVRVVNAWLPWVRTPMMDATGKYEDTRAMTPDQAARWMVEGIVTRKQHVMTSDVRRRFAFTALRPETVTRLMNVLYRIYSDDPEAHPEVALDRMILKKFVKGRLL